MSPSLPTLSDGPMPLGPRGGVSASPIVLGALLGRLGAELARMGLAGHALQEALSAGFGEGPRSGPGPSLIVAMQALDALTQEVEALANVAAALAHATPQVWTLAPDALPPVPLAGLDAALRGEGGPALGPTSGDLDHWGDAPDPWAPWVEV